MSEIVTERIVKQLNRIAKTEFYLVVIFESGKILCSPHSFPSDILRILLCLSLVFCLRLMQTHFKQTQIKTLINILH